jgi:hypothetical protein
MNLAEYYFIRDNNYPALSCLPRTATGEQPVEEFVCYVDAGMSLHDVMLRIQQFESRKEQKENDNQP